jgi:hypothetical protein
MVGIMVDRGSRCQAENRARRLVRSHAIFPGFAGRVGIGTCVTRGEYVTLICPKMRGCQKVRVDLVRFLGVWLSTCYAPQTGAKTFHSVKVRFDFLCLLEWGGWCYSVEGWKEVRRK